MRSEAERASLWARSTPHPSCASQQSWQASLTLSPVQGEGDLWQTHPVGELLLPVGVGRPGAAALGVAVLPPPGRPMLVEPGVPVGTTG